MSYNIAGHAIKNEYLALGTILSTIGIAVVASGGGDKKKAAAPAPIAKDTTINTGDKDEDALSESVSSDRTRTTTLRSVCRLDPAALAGLGTASSCSCPARPAAPSPSRSIASDQLTNARSIRAFVAEAEKSDASAAH
ncbi:uncharacterized protein LOC62_06G008621 [Vanrija pseudolonga]|uniref:Uncharacterized protein n=1 Tax=Vanrija pseudolonga TaxID=143232 RepID=A0AAF1BLK0_9TREE|nr:hypothetical protein LOC62_06G008621 [Vanrija pseudolonga]